MIYLRPTPPRDGAFFFSAGLLAGLVGAVLATGDAFGLLPDVGAPCVLEVSPAASRFAKLLASQVAVFALYLPWGLLKIN